jgi:hypothetical protein
MSKKMFLFSRSSFEQDITLVILLKIAILALLYVFLMFQKTSSPVDKQQAFETHFFSKER